MRDIKFRAWDADNSFMIDENYNDDDYLLTFDGLTPKLIGIKFDSHDYANVANTVLMQSTGLQDKNGVDIYEGDILYHKVQGLRTVIYPMSEGVAAFGLVRTNGMKNYLQDAQIYTVMGNIYENSDLLK